MEERIQSLEKQVAELRSELQEAKAQLQDMKSKLEERLRKIERFIPILDIPKGKRKRRSEDIKKYRKLIENSYYSKNSFSK